jgi:hypothetical protein
MFCDLFSGILRGAIGDVIASFCVLPNRITIPLLNDSSIFDLKYPMPKVLYMYCTSLERILPNELSSSFASRDDSLLGVLLMSNLLY